MLNNSIRLYYVNTLKIKFIFSSFIILTLGLSSCSMNTPAHTVVITGELLVHEDKKNLCFEPDLDSTDAPFPYETTHIRMQEFRILDSDTLSILIILKPLQERYILLSRGDKVCLNPINFKMEETKFLTPEKGQKLIAQISGLDEKREHYVTFTTEFNYR